MPAATLVVAAQEALFADLAKRVFDGSAVCLHPMNGQFDATPQECVRSYLRWYARNHLSKELRPKAIAAIERAQRR